MALNTNLFPADYGNLCPVTQVEEANRIEELELQILRLRNQHLMQARRSGVSLAELQNQTLYLEQRIFRNTSGATPAPPIVIVQPPPPQTPATTRTQNAAPAAPTPQPLPAPIPSPPATPPGVGRCYIAGGWRANIHGQVDKFVYRNEVRSVMAFDLSIPRARHAGWTGWVRAFYGGGQTAIAAASRTNNIQSILYASETRHNESAVLGATRVYSRATSAETKAYIAGNYSPNQSTVDICSFTSPPTVSANAFSLTGIVGGCNAFSSNTKSYFSSGWNDTRAIVAITHATDATATLAAQLSVVRIRGGSFASTTRGYVAGGFRNATATNQITIDRLLFSNEAIAVLAKQMNRAGADIEGIASHLKGYCFGGTPKKNATQVSSLPFQNESWTVVQASLSHGGRYSVAAGRP